MHIPSEIIVYISQYFSDGRSFVSFGMMNKRAWGLVLEHIKEHNHTQSRALDQFVHFVFSSPRYIRKPTEVYFGYQLPNTHWHGKRESWACPALTNAQQAELDQGLMNPPPQPRSKKKKITDSGSLTSSMEDQKRQFTLNFLQTNAEGGLCTSSYWFMGMRQGLSREFSEDEELQEETPYEKGLRQGRSIQLFAGQVIAESEYNQGEKHGSELRYWDYKRGWLRSRKHFLHGKAEGEYEMWDLDGNAAAPDVINQYIATHRNNLDPAIVIPYLARRVHYVAGLLQGTAETWARNGVRTVFVDKSDTQVILRWNEDGTPTTD